MNDLLVVRSNSALHTAFTVPAIENTTSRHHLLSNHGGLSLDIVTSCLSNGITDCTTHLYIVNYHCSSITSVHPPLLSSTTSTFCIYCLLFTIYAFNIESSSSFIAVLCVLYHCSSLSLLHYRSLCTVPLFLSFITVLCVLYHCSSPSLLFSVYCTTVPLLHCCSLCTVPLFLSFIAVLCVLYHCSSPSLLFSVYCTTVPLVHCCSLCTVPLFPSFIAVLCVLYM